MTRPPSRNAGTALGWVAAARGIGGAVLPWGVGAASVTPVGWTGGLALVPLAMLGVAAVSAWLARR